MTTGQIHRVIVDACLALKWVIPEADSAAADDLYLQWGATGVEVYAPSWMSCEVANILFQAVRKGEITEGDAQARHTLAMDAVKLLRESAGDGAAAIAIAGRLQQRASYDSQYLALSERLECELWTADNHFAQAAQAAGYRVRMLGAE